MPRNVSLHANWYTRHYMDNLADILARKDFDQPNEITILKRYVLEHFGADVSVAIRGEQLVVSAPSSSLINTLRLHQVDLKRACGTEKRFVFRST